MNGAEFSRMSRSLAGRVAAMVSRAVLRRADDEPQLQAVQVDLLADETLDQLERFQDYGFTSVPKPGAEVAVMFAGGLRSHGIVVAVADRRFRMKGLQEGEVAIYDDQGQFVLLGRDGIRIETSKPLTVSADSVTIEASAVDLGGAGGQPVARVGDSVADGVITSGSNTVRAI